VVNKRVVRDYEFHLHHFSEAVRVKCLPDAQIGAPQAIHAEGTILDISFEVYPPRKTEDEPRLHEAIAKLGELGPRFISVTFGAGGSSTKNSLDVLRQVRALTEAMPLAHLTCVSTTESEAADLVREFEAAGITDFLALRGDLPEGQSAPGPDSLARADQLVSLIRAQSTGKIAVAAFPNGHPESGVERSDLDALLAKQEAGADFAITQLFFYTSDYLEFLELARERGVTIPIIPGIMPIVSARRLERVLELTGERRPEPLASQLAQADDAAARIEIGVDWAAKQVAELNAAGIDAVHLYAFNEYKNVSEVLRRAGVRG